MPKTNKNPRIFISPISREITAAIKQFDPLGDKIGLILSQRQHNVHGGYIPESIIDEVYDMPHLLERDHFHNAGFDDNSSDHFDYDASVFDVIHLDPWSNTNGKLPGYAGRKINRWVSGPFNYKTDLMFEIGTEEFVCILDAEKLQESLVNNTDRIQYIVCQGGSVVFNLENQAPIEVEKTKSFVDLAKNLRCKTKRHNCDFHTDEELKTLSQIGIDAFNFAPEFTYISNKIIADSLSQEQVAEYYHKILDNAPWDRWLTSDAEPLRFLYACLHYLSDDLTIINKAEYYHSKIVRAMVERMEQIWVAIS